MNGRRVKPPPPLFDDAMSQNLNFYIYSPHHVRRGHCAGGVRVLSPIPVRYVLCAPSSTVTRKFSAADGVGNNTGRHSATANEEGKTWDTDEPLHRCGQSR